MLKLYKLAQEVINQIAAGEIIERPSSIIKELVDNAIDAKASEINIRISEGGIKEIEITDNGIGIEKDNLKEIFQPHTTSKLKDITDLNTLNTMGFRGEALATILSVAQVNIVSKHKESEFGYEVNLNTTQEPKKSSKEKGTTITVKNLFYNTPARLKFLKTPETEYRKIYEVLVKYALCYPNIKFSFHHNDKLVFNLFNTSEQVLDKDRVLDLLSRKIAQNMIEIKSEGAGIVINGYIGQPSDASIRQSHQYIFVNRRPIWESGIAKAVSSGFSRFIPNGLKVPFVIKIDISPDQLDVNVHPRKEEIRFLNPYRVYQAIENSVSQSLKTHTQESISNFATPITSNFETTNSFINDKPSNGYITGSQTKELRFDKKPADFNITKSLNFSQQLLKHDEILNTDDFKNIFQVFNKYIVLEFIDQVWLIDQHAAAERINFEKLLTQQKSNVKDIQAILMPIEIELSIEEISIISENIKLFKDLGFDIEIKKDLISIRSIPAYIESTKVEEIFKSLTLEQADREFQTIMEGIIATVACHGSVRSGQSLSKEECVSIFTQLKRCNNPYSCPHGRPAVWKLKLSEIDTHFLRTY